ncbi:MAG: lysoplasmalogenase family protein, partial [Omnitrophica WOR_2 bacterium]
PILIVLIAFWLIYNKLSASLSEHKQNGLKIPVLIYAIVISLMLLSAVFTFLKPDWGFPATALVTAGALLFYISDTILAWNKFVSPVHNGRLLNISAYHLGQILLITGAAINFLSNKL